MIPEELEDPGAVRHVWLGVRSSRAIGLTCLHVTLSPLYGPHFLHLDSCSLRALADPAGLRPLQSRAGKGLTNSRQLKEDGGT